MATNKSSGNTSNGIHRNVSGKTLAGMRAARPEFVKMLNIQDAWLKGKNPWVTIQNPNKEQTNKKFIRVKANDLYGSPKERSSKMFVMAGS